MTGDWTRSEWRDARLELRGAGALDRGRHEHWLLVVHRPSIRPLSAVDAAEEDGARRASYAEIMTPRQVAVQPVPHISLKISTCSILFKRKDGAAFSQQAVAILQLVISEENLEEEPAKGPTMAGSSPCRHAQIWDLRLRVSYLRSREADGVRLEPTSAERYMGYKRNGARSQHRHPQVLDCLGTL